MSNIVSLENLLRVHFKAVSINILFINLWKTKRLLSKVLYFKS